MFIKTTIFRLFRDSTAATAIEYGLLISLIAISIYIAVGGLAGANQAGWNLVLNSANAAAGIAPSA